MADASAPSDDTQVTLDLILAGIRTVGAGLTAAMPDNALVALMVSQIGALVESGEKIMRGEEPQPMASYDDGLRQYLAR